MVPAGLDVMVGEGELMAIGGDNIQLTSVHGEVDAVEIIAGLFPADAAMNAPQARAQINAVERQG